MRQTIAAPVISTNLSSWIFYRWCDPGRKRKMQCCLRVRSLGSIGHRPIIRQHVLAHSSIETQQPTARRPPASMRYGYHHIRRSAAGNQDDLTLLIGYSEMLKMASLVGTTNWYVSLKYFVLLTGFEFVRIAVHACIKMRGCCTSRNI